MTARSFASVRRAGESQGGFTLIEVLVYLSLFAIILGGAIIAAYSVFESSGRNQTSAMVQEEGDFLIGKVSWALSGAEAVNLPAVNSAGSILSVNKVTGVNSFTGQTTVTPIVVDMDPVVLTDIRITEGANPPQTLNNTNVQVSGLQFDHESASGDGLQPESVAASFTVSARTPNGAIISRDFSKTTYIRR